MNDSKLVPANRYNGLIGYVTITTSTMSVIASLSIIIPIIYRRVGLKPAIFQVLNISSADFLASIFMLSSVIQYFIMGVNNVTPTCLMTVIISNAFYASSFIFLILYAAQAFSAVLSKRKGGQMWRIFNTNYRLNFFNVIYFLGWVVPITISIPVFINFYVRDENITDLEECHTCLPLLNFKNPVKCESYSVSLFKKANKYRYLFMIPQLGTLTMLIILLSLTLVEYRKYLNLKGIFGRAEQKHWSKMKQRVCYFIFSFVFCWICSIILNIVLLCSSLDINRLYPFYITESMTNPLHGFLNAIIYGWQRKSFTNILIKQTSLEVNFLSVSDRHGGLHSQYDDGRPFLSSDNTDIFGSSDSVNEINKINSN